MAGGFGEALRIAQPGMSRLAASIGGNQAFEMGRQGELALQSRLAQALSQQRANDASADLSAVKAEGARAAAAARTPEALRDTAMTSQGIPLEEGQAVEQYLKTGTLGGKFAPSVDGMGPVAPAPEWGGKLGDVARAIAGTQTALTIGDKNSENVAKAGAINRKSALSDAIIAGTKDRNIVGGAQAAADGKDLFHADSTGSVLDKFTGALDVANPMAKSTIGLRTEQAGQAKAGAAENYAQAESAKALAAQRRQITANGPGPGKVPTGYRYTTDANGEAKLEPIPGGPKDPNAQTGKPLPASAAKGYLENVNALRTVEDALKMIDGQAAGQQAGDANATGWKGYLPDAILSRVDGQGVPTRAAIADIGSLKIHDRSGAAVTAAETPRLKPFIPSVTDSPAVAADKMRQFEHNYRAILEDSEEFYRASGYNLPTVPSRRASGAPKAPAATPTRINNDADFKALPSGTEFIAPDGSRRRKP